MSQMVICKYLQLFLNILYLFYLIFENNVWKNTDDIHRKSLKKLRIPSDILLYTQIHSVGHLGPFYVSYIAVT